MHDAASIHLWLGLGLLALALAVQAFTLNRLVRRKLRLTLALAALSLLVGAAERSGLIPADIAPGLRSLGNLLVALALANFLVVVLLNPLRADRVPAHLPSIVQDAIVVLLFLVVATILLRETLLLTSAVGAVVVGFALQDTLGNAFAGLALQTEKPFKVGQWVRIGDHEGRVEELTWRATKLRTRQSTFVIVPNNQVSGNAIENFSEPIRPTRIHLEVGVTYNAPPNEVKAAFLAAVRQAPLALPTPEPDVLLHEFGDSSIVYQARFWIDDCGLTDEALDEVRTALWYELGRRGIEIPYPIQIEMSREEPPARDPGLTPRFAATLARVRVLGALDVAERLELASLARPRLFGAGERVVRQGEAGQSMFVVVDGDVRVVLEPGGEQVASLGPGEVFGEMSLLTGDPRTATVRAVGDALLMEIDAEGFRRFVLDRPEVLGGITEAVAARRAELERSRSSVSVTTGSASPETLLARVRRFLRLAA